MHLAKKQTSAFLSEFHGVVADREVLHDRSNMDDGLLSHGWATFSWQLQPKRKGIWHFFDRISG